MALQVNVQSLQPSLSYLGSLLQFGSGVLLIALFLLLRPYARRRKYFATWSYAWVALSIALCMVMIRFNVLPVVFGTRLEDSTLGIRLILFVYQLSKVAFYGLLIAGTLHYVGRTPRFPAITGYAVFALIFAAISFWFTRRMAGMVIWQAPLAIALLGYAAYMMLSLPPSRRSLGTGLTGSCFAFGALVWMLYGIAFSMPGPGNPLAPVISFNTYLDLFWNITLGFGMVVMLMEDAKNEVDAAHAELNVAHDNLRRASFYDSVTGSLNRQAFAERLGLDAALAGFGAVVVLDLDNLKNINDRHGHAAGDMMLRHIVEVLRPQLRVADKLYRWGGDEFLLVFPGADAPNVGRRIKTILHESKPLHLEDGGELPVRVSVGAAAYSSGEKIDMAIAVADQAMYSDKVSRKIAFDPGVAQTT